MGVVDEFLIQIKVWRYFFYHHLLLSHFLPLRFDARLSWHGVFFYWYRAQTQIP